MTTALSLVALKELKLHIVYS